MSKFQYDLTHSFEERVAEIKKITSKHPDKIPVLIEKHSNSELPKTAKCKFLIPKNLTVGQLIFVIRKHLGSLSQDKALFIYINKSLPMTGATMSSLYEKHKSPDGFLRVIYSGENTFG